METKICTKCKKELPTENFNVRKDNKSGFRSHCKECIYKENRKYSDDHMEESYEWEKKYREKNKEMIKIRSHNYNLNNRDIKTACNQRYKARKKLLPNDLTVQQWLDIKQVFSNRCAYCGKNLPLAQEHFIACSKGGEYTNNNIIPSCQCCNSSKGNKDFFNWYKKHKYYSSKREKLILNFLGYKNGVQQLKII